MIGHAIFIWSSYAVAFVGLAGLAAVSLLDRRKVRREIAERGLERPREQRATRGLR
jgi:heme exporter protein CcmD